MRHGGTKAGRLARAAVAVTVVVGALAVAVPGGAAPKHGTAGKRGKKFTTTTTTVATSGALVSDAFTQPDGLVTNEWAYRNADDPRAVLSPTWEMTSGSLFAKAGTGWTGVPDGDSPGPDSGSATGSAVFRLTSKRQDLRDVAVAFRLRVNALVETSRTPAVAWDGVHVFLRYQSQYHLYYASVNRRDGSVVVKKKCPGGTTNGGTYYTLGTFAKGHQIPVGSWQRIEAQVRTNADGSVTVRVHRDGVLVKEATDTGVGCAVIRDAGRVGIRGDNADFQFDDFAATGI